MKTKVAAVTRHLAEVTDNRAVTNLLGIFELPPSVLVFGRVIASLSKGMSACLSERRWVIP